MHKGAALIVTALRTVARQTSGAARTRIPTFLQGNIFSRATKTKPRTRKKRQASIDTQSTLRLCGELAVGPPWQNESEEGKTESKLLGWNGAKRNAGRGLCELACAGARAFDLPQTIKKLITPKLCPQCLALLDSANVQESVKKACLDLAKRAVRARFLHQLLTVLGHPLVGFFFGGAFSVVVVEGLRKYEVDAFWASLIFLTLPLVVIIILILISRWRSRNDLF